MKPDQDLDSTSPATQPSSCALPGPRNGEPQPEWDGSTTGNGEGGQSYETGSRLTPPKSGENQGNGGVSWPLVEDDPGPDDGPFWHRLEARKK